MIIESSHLDDLENVAQELVNYADEYKVWLFQGEMGAGKTTLIRALGDFFDVQDTVNSPTFALVNEYQDSAGASYFHFDFYRIKNEQEAEDMGWFEYVDSGNYCWVEWPSKIPNLLPEQYLEISIQVAENDKRVFEVVKHG